MKIKLLTIVLAVTVCVGLFSGCQSSKLGSYSEDAAASASPEVTDTSNTTKDYTPAYESYDPDEVMLSVNGIDVTWGELFYWYQYDVSNMENNYGDITDWDAECSFAEGKTNREYVMENALDTVKHYCALQSKADDMGLVLTDEDKAELQTVWDNNVTNYGNGDEATFIEYLKKAFLSKELYDHINEVSMLYERMQEKMFGTNGENISETEVLQKAGDMGYVRAKHILISSKDDSGATLPDDQLAANKATAESIIKELKAIKDKTSLETRFNELITEYSSDPGAAYYTDGYTFVSGDGTYDSTFDSAVAALGEYEVSDIVETDYGYHIILRLPLKADAAVKYTSETEMTTLAYYVAQQLFTAETDSWAEESTVKFTKTYEKMDIADVFAKAVRTAAAS